MLSNAIILLEKVKYYKIINSGFQSTKQNSELLDHYQNLLDAMTIKIESILTKGYSLII